MEIVCVNSWAPELYMKLCKCFLLQTAVQFSFYDHKIWRFNEYLKKKLWIQLKNCMKCEFRKYLIPLWAMTAPLRALSIHSRIVNAHVWAAIYIDVKKRILPILCAWNCSISHIPFFADLLCVIIHRIPDQMGFDIKWCL